MAGKLNVESRIRRITIIKIEPTVLKNERNYASWPSWLLVGVRLTTSPQKVYVMNSRKEPQFELNVQRMKMDAAITRAIRCSGDEASKTDSTTWRTLSSSQKRGTTSLIEYKLATEGKNTACRIMQQFKRRQAFVVTYCELWGAEKQIWRMEPINTRKV